MNRRSSHTAAAGARRGLSVWAEHHVHSLVSSLGRMAGKPWSTALTIGVLAVAFALPLGLALILDNVARLSGSVQQSREIDLFLSLDVDAARAGALAEELRARDDVADVELRTPEQGLAQLRAVAGLGDAIEAVGENPLPSLLIVVPAGDELALAAQLRQLPEADLVQHDAQWRQRLDDWLDLGRRIAWLLALLLGFGALLVVGNTVRLELQSRREEIGILQLLGATDGFIRRPFLYLGVWYGLLAGLLALVLMLAAGVALREPLAALVAGYGSGFSLRGFDPVRTAAILAGTAIVGWLGAVAVTTHHLRQTRETGR